MELIFKLLEKMSAYQVLNYLIPGSVLVVLLKHLVGIDLLQFSTWELLIVCYFIGMVNGRLASLLLGPLLKKSHFVIEEPYECFLRAEKVDSKVQVLSDIYVLFRSLANAMILLLIVFIMHHFVSPCSWFWHNINWISMIGLGVLFLFATRKQADFVSKRIKENNKKSSRRTSVK